MNTNLDKVNTNFDKTIALEFQKLLLLYIKELRTDISEISIGLGLSRPTIQNFLNADVETIKLPDKISRTRINNLWTELTNPEKLDHENPGKRYKRESDELANRTLEEVRDEAIKNRQTLKERGSDELMIAAGFLPTQMKWIGVSLDRHLQMMQMALLLDNPILSFNSFMKVTKDELQSIIIRIANITEIDNKTESQKNLVYKDQQSNPRNQILQGLSKNPTLDPNLRNQLLKKFDKACHRILGESPQYTLSVEETLNLFSTILSNELNQQERLNLKFRVINIDLETLSIDLFKYLSSIDLKSNLEKIANILECELHTIANPNTESKPYIPSVIKASVTCSYSPDSIVGENHKSREYITFSYASCGDASQNLAAKAVALHLGFCEDTTPEVNTEKINGRMASLVKCTATLQGDNDSTNVQGDWVDTDFLKTYVQAMLIAGEKWLFLQTDTYRIDPQKYLEIFQKFSSLEDRLSNSRNSFHDYQLSQDFQTSKELEKIAQEARNSLEKYEDITQNNNSLKAFKVGLNRIYLISKIHQVQLKNIQGDIKNTRILVKEIDRYFDQENIKNILCPVAILFETECLLYKLSSGVNKELFSADSKYWEDWLSNAKSQINDYLSKINPKYSSGPDVVVYQSLGTIHLIAGRWLFYLGKSKNEIELSYKYFLNAAHYFSRIGFAFRVARCLSIAGRAQIRMKNYSLAKELLDDATKLVNSHLHEGQKQAFVEAVSSEIYLLEGEYELYANSNYRKALDSSLKGLKGAMWLGLARRMSDNLHNIWQCAQHLEKQSVRESLDFIFGIYLLQSQKNSNITKNKKFDQLKNEKFNPLGNNITEHIINILFEIYDSSDKQTWKQVAGQFQKMSSNIWHNWYRESNSTGLIDGHPVGILIDEDNFLKPIP